MLIADEKARSSFIELAESFEKVDKGDHCSMLSWKSEETDSARMGFTPYAVGDYNCESVYDTALTINTKYLGCF
jgi:hypothetical protein